jgi:hypothetical protein
MFGRKEAQKYRYAAMPARAPIGASMDSFAV